MLREMKRSKLMRMVTSPIRIIARATDLYKRSMNNLVSEIRLPRSSSSSKPRTRSFKNSRYYEEPESERSTRGPRPRSEFEVSRMMMGRSYSVGIGRIGRIDEDLPCNFEEEDEDLDCDYDFGNVKNNLMLQRSSSYGMRRKRRSNGARVGFY